MVILDTSIIIDHLRRIGSGKTALVRVAETVSKENLALSVISVQELYEGRSTKDRHKEEHLLATITPLRIMPYIYEVAHCAGMLARDIRRPIELADAAIAATALVNGAAIYTLNKKDFEHIPGLELWEL